MAGVFCRTSHRSREPPDLSKRWGRETKIVIFSSRRCALARASRAVFLRSPHEPDQPGKHFEVLRQNRKSEG